MKHKHKFRASSLGLIMADPTSIDKTLLDDALLEVYAKKKKTDDDNALLAPYWDRSLSAGAKTVCEDIAKQMVYGFDVEVTGKYMDKGLQVEDAAIELVNTVFFTNYKKNTVRLSNEWITGECDILIPGKKIIDVKSSWSLDTFPATSRAGMDKGYEWQGRAYMWLWDVPEFEINYCMVNTPDDLIGYEDTDLHYVDHIAPELRITRVCYKRDKALEAKMATKAEAAQQYIESLIQQIAAEHNY